LEWALLGAHQGDLADEEKRLRALVESGHPGAAAIREALARGYQIAGRWPEAMQEINAILRSSPDHAAMLVQRGTILRRLGGVHSMGSAEQDFRRAVALAPENPRAQAALAGALSDLGYLQEAASHYELVLRSEPTNPGALLGLARALTDGAHVTEAEQRLDQLLAAYPDHAHGLVERGRLALRQGRPAEAAGYLARAVHAAPWHRDGNRLYLLALKETGQSEPAAQCEAHLAELKAEDARKGRLDTRLVHALNDPSSYWDLYQWSLRNGKDEEALGYLVEVLRHDPRHRMAHEALADYFDRAGQPRRAAQHRAAAGGPG
jgi:predicted Zn-dependent protease